MKRKKKITAQTCIWRLNSEGFYDTGCGEAFQLSNDASLWANGFRFCHHCGKRIEEVTDE